MKESIKQHPWRGQAIKKASRSRQRQNRVWGLCVVCGKPPRPNKRKCELCAQLDSARSRAAYWRKKAKAENP